MKIYTNQYPHSVDINDQYPQSVDINEHKHKL